MDTAASAPGIAASREGLDVAALFDAHAPFLLRTVQRLTGPGPHVEDVVQEVFLTAHRRRHELSGDDVRGWLYRVAQNLVRHHYRSLARQRRLRDKALVEESARSVALAPALEQKENAARVWSVVGRLPLKLREVFVLYELEELSSVEIARLLDIPENTARSRLRLARERFRERWSASAEGRGGET